MAGGQGVGWETIPVGWMVNDAGELGYVGRVCATWDLTQCERGGGKLSEYSQHVSASYTTLTSWSQNQSHSPLHLQSPPQGLARGGFCKCSTNSRVHPLGASWSHH